MLVNKLGHSEVVDIMLRYEETGIWDFLMGGCAHSKCHSGLVPPPLSKPNEISNFHNVLMRYRFCKLLM